MDQVVSAAEANRAFSRLLRGVREGQSYTVTAHGRPVARIVPVDSIAEAEERVREAARRELFCRIANQPVYHVGKWTRDELYDK